MSIARTAIATVQDTAAPMPATTANSAMASNPVSPSKDTTPARRAIARAADSAIARRSGDSRSAAMAIAGRLRVVRLADVPDLSVVAGVAVHPVGDNLCTAIGKVDRIGALGAVPQTVLLRVYADAGVGVLDSVGGAVVGYGVVVLGVPVAVRSAASVSSGATETSKTASQRSAVTTGRGSSHQSE